MLKKFRNPSFVGFNIMSTFLNSQIKIYFFEKQTHMDEIDITLTFGTFYLTHIERGFLTHILRCFELTYE